ncbi:Variant-specific surface protein [Giardia duodenalis]|uniref:Variant-specific surface protein n=1 Tax=Giardia intestinalis TaxID=5741 RepID=V6TSC2_GIAIN|nr:Variant-specific surface protein [Giardia intestinalis]
MDVAAALAAGSALVLCGALPARGGCYNISVAGSRVCREARDRACVMYAEELNVGRTGARERVASGTCTVGSGAGKCKTAMCNVWIGGKDYCSQCAETAELLIDGTCVASTTELAKKCTTNNQGACSSCGDGYFLYSNGCYAIGGTPGSSICADPTPTNPTDTAGKCATCATGYFKNPTAAGAAVPPCIACNDTTGDGTSIGKAGCATCEPPKSSGVAKCTACLGGFFGTGSAEDITCTPCTGDCQTCKGAATQCTSCKDTNPYFKKGESNDGTGTCISEATCKDGIHFPTTDKTNQKKICAPCNDASNGGIADCKTCAPKTTASLADAPSVTCSACTTDTNKPNKAGTKCFDY